MAVGAFVYYAQCVVSHVAPQAMQARGAVPQDSEGAVTVVGSHFRAETRVRVGGVLASGGASRVVSSTLMLVSAPPLPSGPAEVTCSSNGADFASAGVYISVTSPVVTASIRPSRGRPEGGTAVTVFGETFSPDVRLTCVFGGVSRDATWLREGTTVHTRATLTQI